jgi:hypothetical protein
MAKTLLHQPRALNWKGERIGGGAAIGLE